MRKEKPSRTSWEGKKSQFERRSQEGNARNKSQVRKKARDSKSGAKDGDVVQANVVDKYNTLPFSLSVFTLFIASVLLECEWVCDKRIKLQTSEYYAEEKTRISTLSRCCVVASLNCKTVSISLYYSLQNSTISFSTLLFSILLYIHSMFSISSNNQRDCKRTTKKRQSHGIVCHCSTFAFNLNNICLICYMGGMFERSESDETREKSAGREARMSRTQKCSGNFFLCVCVSNRLENVREQSKSPQINSHK